MKWNSVNLSSLTFHSLLLFCRARYLLLLSFTLQLFTCNIYTQQHKSELSGRKLFLLALQLSQATDSINNFCSSFTFTTHLHHSCSFLFLFSWFGHTNDINIFHFSTSYQFKHVKDTFSSLHFLLLIFSQTHYTARLNDWPKAIEIKSAWFAFTTMLCAVIESIKFHYTIHHRDMSKMVKNPQIFSSYNFIHWREHVRP